MNKEFDRKPSFRSQNRNQHFSCEETERTRRSDDFFDSASDSASGGVSASPVLSEGRAEESNPEETPILSGLKPVLELLEREPSRIDLVLVRKGQRSRETDRILDLCRAHGVRFLLTDMAGIERLCPRGHQGVAARLFDAGFTDWNLLLEQAVDAPLPLIVMLDQVQDPGNAGTLARTLYALGGAGLVIPRHNGAYLGSGARRAAAGALERLPVARVMNLSRALDEADAAGFQIYGTAADGESVNVFTASLYTPAILVLGSEEHGIRPQIRKRCHHLLRIPMLRDFDSLNVAQAGAILIGSFARSK